MLKRLLFILICLTSLSAEAKTKYTVKATIVTRRESKEYDIIVSKDFIKGRHEAIRQIRLDAKGAKRDAEIAEHYGGITNWIQDGVTYMNEKGKKVKISAKDALEIRFTHLEKEYRFYSISVGENKKMFLPKIIEGPLELYISESQRSEKKGTSIGVFGNQKGKNVFNYYVGRSGRRNAKKIRLMAIRKDVRPFVSQCKELVELMDDTKYMMKNGFGLYEIIEYFNEKCGIK